MFQTDFTIEELRTRRERVADEIGKGAIAVVQGACGSASMGVFRQYNGMYYLSGIEAPHSYLVIEGGTGRSALYLPRASQLDQGHELRVISADDPEHAQETTGVDTVRGVEALAGRLQNAGVVYTFLREGQSEMATPGSLAEQGRGVMSDPWDGRPGRAAHFANVIRTRCPRAELRDLTPTVTAMRLVKSPAEQALCRRAGELSARGLVDAVRATAPGVMEYQLDAVLRYHYVAGGSRGRGYSAIVGGGVNAFHGHYKRNDCELKDGDWILLDCAPDYRYYTSDITRMWPVNGTYSPAQRALYGFVIEYHKVLLAGIRPGRTCAEITEESAEVMKGRIGEFRFATPEHEAGARRMFEFRGHLSHSVGMCVHDGGGHKAKPLEPGIVFSVDPQLHIPDEKLYVRCEDTGVVTDDGFDVFTKDAPLELDDIEAMMKEEGILQRFPPVAGGE
ncbi:MAG: aminopeptidase P N-terminal domain-containing protein [Planctomycetota bacterium]|jgi:Xaa-Pro aminopeptidase